MRLRQCIFLFAIVFLIDAVAADTQCGDFIGITCPSFFKLDAKYCCESSNGSPYCCTEEEFYGRLGAGLIVTIVVIITGSLIACCLCCLCCPCCILYKRRNAGTVYVPAINGSVVVQSQQGIIQPMQPNVPYPVQPQAAAYPVTGYMPMPTPEAAAAAVPRHDPGYMQQPPPYSVATANDPYVKQAPYNPTY